MAEAYCEFSVEFWKLICKNQRQMLVLSRDFGVGGRHFLKRHSLRQDVPYKTSI